MLKNALLVTAGIVLGAGGISALQAQSNESCCRKEAQWSNQPQEDTGNALARIETMWRKPLHALQYKGRSVRGLKSTANAERPNRGLDLNVAITALRASREPERTLGGIEDSLSAAAVGVVDELVEPHTGVWPDVQGGLIVKAQTGNACLVGANGLISMDATASVPATLP